MRLYHSVECGWGEVTLSFLYRNFNCVLYTDQMKDFDRWNKSKKKIDRKLRPTIRQGKVYWCNLGANIGVEQDGRGDNFQRLVIVIKKFSNQLTLVAPLTTKLHSGNWYLNIHILERDAQIILNQTRPVDTKRLLEEVGEISENKVKEIVQKYINLII